MTLGRLNLAGPRPVIGRNDDSGDRQVRAVVLGEPGLFVDVLVDAIQKSGITTWWADWDAPKTLIDDLTTKSADLVVLHLADAGYTEDARDLIRRLASRHVLAIALDRAVRPPSGRSWVEAGALWAVNPLSASLDELAFTIQNAADRRGAARRLRHRAALAGEAWSAAVVEARALESSILTMRRNGLAGDDAPHGNGLGSQTDGDPSRRLTRGDQGRQV